MIKVPAYGPDTARIMIVGEAPGTEESRAGQPFFGQSGQELTRMLHEAGIMRTECYITNICKYQPPGNDISHFILGMTTKTWEGNNFVKEGLAELFADIERIKPSVIVALGNVPLYYLADKKGISKWRGSIIYDMKHNCKVIPTYHPAAILRNWDWRSIAVHDLRRAKTESETSGPSDPAYDFIVRPTADQVLKFLRELTARADGMIK